MAPCRPTTVPRGSPDSRGAAAVIPRGGNHATPCSPRARCDLLNIKMPVDKTTGRVNYSKLQREEEMPNLLAVQLESYHDFLQLDRAPDQREDVGLESVFRTVFPIESTRGHLVMEYISFSTGEPKYGIAECQERGLTFSVPLKVKLRLVVKELEEGAAPDAEPQLRDIQEDDVYLGELPMITEQGHLRDQRRRARDRLAAAPLAGRVLQRRDPPQRPPAVPVAHHSLPGSWVEFTTDINDVLYVHIDRKRKQPVSMLMRALGFESDEEIIAQFHEIEHAQACPARAPRSTRPWPRSSRAGCSRRTSGRPRPRPRSPRPARSSTRCSRRRSSRAASARSSSSPRAR